MKYTLLTFLALVLLWACSEDDPLVEDDYRLAFVGKYDCELNKGNPIPGPDVELVIRIDSTTDNRIIVANDTVPISTDGTFGPGELRPGFYYELRINGDSIYLNHHILIPNGIALPCKFECIRQ
ncbi:MAG: hypothetical protein HKN09_06615 [Saprospiraceae bacterium]|nr:hypothetical protein [Saprospiraceae bacterium]